MWVERQHVVPAHKSDMRVRASAHLTCTCYRWPIWLEGSVHALGPAGPSSYGMFLPLSHFMFMSFLFSCAFVLGPREIRIPALIFVVSCRSGVGSLS